MKLLPRTLRLLLVVLLAVPCLTQGAAVAQEKKPVKLADAFGNRDFYSMGIPLMKWMKDGRRYSFVKRNPDTKDMDIYTSDAVVGDEMPVPELMGLHRRDSNEPFHFLNYIWSPDERQIMFLTSEHRIWRHSITGDYVLYDLNTHEFVDFANHEEGIRSPKFSPDGLSIGYVYNGNIFVYNLQTKNTVQLTTDAEDHVFNGHFGWVYEEEFSIIDGWRWSPDSKSIAYWQVDERNVPTITLTDWMPDHYELVPIRYPKAGDPNPIVKIGMVPLSTQRTIWMDIGTEKDQYIPRIYWTNNPDKLCIIRMNRLQNHEDVIMADASTGESKIILTEDAKNGWLEIEDDFIRFLKKSDTFIWPSERTGWKHLYRYDYDGKLLGAVTQGKWEVTDICGFSPDEKTMYYVSTEVSPLERHLYRISIDGKDKTKLTTAPGYHSINMSPKAEAYYDSWSSTKAPTKQAFYNNQAQEERVVSERSPEVYNKYLWQDKEISTFKTSDGLTLYYSLIKPAHFDPNKKYPVYVDVYGGPGYQAVTDRWPSPVHEWIADEGFIVAQIDNRGGGARGAEFKHTVYKELGKWEANDYVEFAKHLATLPYVDKDRLGIWGWSYGGYMAALTMLLGSDYYKAGVAIAPVTDWKFYDTIYTERYMQRPEDNPDGYKVGSCLEHADELKGSLLIIHGGMDDNVHVQNTMQFVDLLETGGKDFDMRIYPNGNHGVVTSMQQRFGLYEYFMKYLKDHLQ